jgi:hypothetical protein
MTAQALCEVAWEELERGNYARAGRAAALAQRRYGQSEQLQIIEQLAVMLLATIEEHDKHDEDYERLCQFFGTHTNDIERFKMRQQVQHVGSLLQRNYGIITMGAAYLNLQLPPAVHERIDVLERRLKSITFC